MLIGIPPLLGPIATSEPRLYGNVVIRKGVIYPKESGNS